MATRRRFEAAPETILRDLAATLQRMRASMAAVALGGRMSQELERKYRRAEIDVAMHVVDLLPVGAAVGFTRGGQAYRFACTKYDDQRDNLRAAQLAVSLLWRVQEEYGVSEGRAAQESFERLFGGHRLQLGDGTTGDAWHEVLKVAPSADLVVIRASYHALSKVLHPDNRATGDAAAMLRLNRAYEEARAALGVA